tara:strand:+ start:752 stop:1753 length:1002 start_codon:yes stop_codon:yes gene_type:complete
MSTHTHLGRCDVPDPSRLPNREARRKFRTGTYSTTIIEEVNRIDTGGGMEKNRARAEGTDTVHADALYNEFDRGIRYDQLPPIVIKTGEVYQLVDGFTRMRALKRRGQEKWVFDVYELNKGFKLRDLLDEIGLGANNHISQKKATKADFILSGIQWVADQEEKTISKVQIKEWVNNIPHSFSNDSVNTIVNNIFAKAYPDTSVTTYTEASASSYLEPLGYSSKGRSDDDGFLGRTFAASSNATHGPRNFCHVLKDFKEHGRKTRINLFAPNGTKAKDVEKVIQAQKDELIEWAEAIQEMAVFIKGDKNWMPFEFGVRPSQLVDVDPDGGVVEL